VTAVAFLRAHIVWFILIAAEILPGIARAVLLVPYMGDFRSRQIGVGTGSLIILAIDLVFVRWIGASGTSQLLGVLPASVRESFSLVWYRWRAVAQVFAEDGR